MKRHPMSALPRPHLAIFCFICCLRHTNLVLGPLPPARFCRYSRLLPYPEWLIPVVSRGRSSAAAIGQIDINTCTSAVAADLHFGFATLSNSSMLSCISSILSHIIPDKSCDNRTISKPPTPSRSRSTSNLNKGTNLRCQVPDGCTASSLSTFAIPPQCL